MRTLVRRLHPDQDLRQQLDELTSSETFSAGVLLSIVGSLTEICLRLPGSMGELKRTGPFEIVSGTGTFGNGVMHIHLSVSDETGAVIGGHLLDGCKIYTTAEIVIGDLSDDWDFARAMDKQTGFPELDPGVKRPW